MKSISTLLLCILFSVSCEKQNIDKYDENGYSFKEGAVYETCYPHGSKDYLHEEWFPCDSTVIWDHYITKKYVTIIIPFVNSLLIAEGDTALVNLHNIDIHIYNPYNGDSVTFKNIFNYIDDYGVYYPIFNLNRRVANKWGYHSGVKTFHVALIHRATGVDIANMFDGHTDITMNFTGL
jgi:hypothetical protein